MIKKVLLGLALLLGLSVTAKAQDETSAFELKLYNTQNKLVTGKNVDLYQGVNKIYDLTESSSVPGVYTATVAHGEYDIYVNTSLWKSGIWIGSNKVSLVVDMFDIDAGADNDTLTVDGHISADSFSGDGSALTGIVGSVSESTGDLIFGADSDANGSGDIILKTAGTEKARLLNNGKFGLGVTSPGYLLQLHTTGTTGLQLTNSFTDSTNVDGSLFSVRASDGSLGIRNFDSTDIYFETDAIERARINASGNIGINMKNPVTKLHVHQGTTYTGSGGIKLTSTASDSLAGDGIGLFLDSSNNAYLENLENGYFRFDVNGSERMIIGADGHIGIGGAAGTSVALDVTSTDGALRIPRMTQTQRDALTASNGMQVYSTSTDKFYFRQNAAWDSLGGGGSDWSKPTSTRIEPMTLSDTVRVNKLRVGTSSTAGYVLTMDADGNAAPAAAASSTFNPLTTFRFFEDFLGGTVTSGEIGEHGWTLYRENGTEFYGYGSAYNVNHPYTFQLLTNNPSTVTLYQGNKALLLDNGYFETSVEVVSGFNVFLFVGIGDVTAGKQGTDFNDAVGFDYSHNTSANWRMVTAKDASRTITESSTAVTTGWHRLKFVVNSGRTSIEFFVDGSSIGTITTNIPVGSADSMFPIFGLRTNAIGYFRLDYFDIKSTVSR